MIRRRISRLLQVLEGDLESPDGVKAALAKLRLQRRIPTVGLQQAGAEVQRHVWNAFDQLVSNAEEEKDEEKDED